jgi:hypothetical protein
MVNTLVLKGMNARYIKVHLNFSDTSYTFAVTHLQNDANVYMGNDPVVTLIPATTGFVNNDTSPTSTALGSFGVTYGAAVDYLNTSVGFDMGASKSAGKIELWDSDATSRAGAVNYALYNSNDNVTYTAKSSSSFYSGVVDNKLVHTFEFDSVDTRYIKVRSSYSDVNYTFSVANLQQDMHIYSVKTALPPSSYKVIATIGYKEVVRPRQKRLFPAGAIRMDSFYRLGESMLCGFQLIYT